MGGGREGQLMRRRRRWEYNYSEPVRSSGRKQRPETGFEEWRRETKHGSHHLHQSHQADRSVLLLGVRWLLLATCSIAPPDSYLHSFCFGPNIKVFWLASFAFLATSFLFPAIVFVTFKCVTSEARWSATFCGGKAGKLFPQPLHLHQAVSIVLDLCICFALFVGFKVENVIRRKKLLN